MRIGIDTLTVNRFDFGGGEKYIYHLLQNLSKLDSENDYFLFLSPQNYERFYIETPNFHNIICNVNATNNFKRIYYTHMTLPTLLQNFKIDLFHEPTNVMPIKVPCRSILTIQYMFSFIMPQDYTPTYRRWYMNSLLKRSAKKADHIISVSFDNKKQIQKYCQTPEDKISVIYHGVSRSFTKTINSQEIDSSKRKYGINNDYILCVANNVLNKNLHGLVQAFEYLKDRYKISHQLVIVGNEGFSQKRRQWLKEILNNHTDIIHLGFIEHKKLPVLYSGASIFVLTSYCESFGMPLLEAMASRIPIVTSNKHSMPEIVGNAGLKVNPLDYKEIGDAIFSILSDRELGNKLIKRGEKHLNQFSWKRTAYDTLAVYERMYK